MGELELERCELSQRQPGMESHRHHRTSPNRRLSASAAPPDAVFLWKQNDLDLYARRPAALAKHLLASGRVRRIVELDAPISSATLEQYGAHAGDSQVDDRPYILLYTARRVLALADEQNHFRRTFVYRTGSGPDRFLGRSLPELDGYGEFVAQQMASAGIADNPLLVVSPVVPYYEVVRDEVEPRMIVADLVDDQRQFPSKPQYRARLEAAYNEILGDADLVTANCKPLLDAFGDLRDDIRVVPNGTDVYPDSDRWETPVELADLPRPIIGYAGNLRHRVDLALVSKIARAHRSASVVLIGGGHNGVNVDEVLSEPNVHLLGPRPQSLTVRYIRAFDVAIMPHLVNSLSDTMNPLKVYLYIALSVPVVTTAVANIDELQSAVSVAQSHAEFLTLLAEHLDGRRQAPTDEYRQRLLATVSWRARVEELWSHVVA
jgi:hypothetical protein